MAYGAESFSLPGFFQGQFFGRLPAEGRSFVDEGNAKAYSSASSLRGSKAVIARKDAVNITAGREQRAAQLPALPR